MSFGKNCVGEIAFLGGGRIAGSLRPMGECKFTGTRVAGSESECRDAASMRYEWQGYNEDEYERERVGRWR